MRNLYCPDSGPACLLDVPCAPTPSPFVTPSAKFFEDGFWLKSPIPASISKPRLHVSPIKQRRPSVHVCDTNLQYNVLRTLTQYYNRHRQQFVCITSLPPWLL